MSGVERPVPQVGGIDHVGLTVASVDAALAFWEPFLGMTASLRAVASGDGLSSFCGLQDVSVDAAKLDLPAGGYIELYEFCGVERRVAGESMADVGRVHVCLRVDDADAAWGRALALGATPVTRNGPVVIGGGPSAGVKAGYLRIHDGITLELIQYPARQAGA